MDSEPQPQPQAQQTRTKQIRVVITPKLHERNHPIPTSFHVFVLGGRGSGLQSEVDEVSMVNGAVGGFKYDLGTSSLPAGSILGIDCFMEEHNRNGVPCQQRVGSVSFALRDLFHAGARGVRMALHHESSGLEQGHLLCVATFTGATDGSFDPPVSPSEWTSESRLRIELAIEDYVRKEMAPFQKKMPGTLTPKWVPSHPFLQRVHAPLHYSRTTIVPGIAFWMQGPEGGVQCEESWCEHWLGIVARRHDRSDEWIIQTITSQFEQSTHLNEPFREACSMILETACSVINSFEYISDWVPDVHGNKVFCESFDEIFVRRSGDCEDGSKGIIELLTAFRSGNWRRPLMQQVQKVCRLYVNFGMLGMVDAPTIRDGRSQQYQAHMFMNWVPIQVVQQWIERDGEGRTMLAQRPIVLEEWLGTAPKPWMEQLEILNGEGTGHVEPNTVPYMHIIRDQQRLEAHMRAAGPPPSVDRMLRPSWLPIGASHRTFYKMHVHGYTNDFFERGYRVGAFTFFNTATNRYGVPYDDAVRGADLVSLRPHLALGDSLLSSLRSILALEHPIPHLRMQTRKIVAGHTNRIVPINAVENARESPEEWLRGLVENWIISPDHRSSVWTDLYVHPQRLTPEQGHELQKYVSHLGVKHIDWIPELDPNCMELCGVRMRLYW